MAITLEISINIITLEKNKKKTRNLNQLECYNYYKKDYYANKCLYK